MVMVVLVAIVLYAMVQINALDDRKNEVKLLKLYGLNDKDIHSLVNENGFVQLLLSLVLGIPCLLYTSLSFDFDCFIA